MFNGKAALIFLCIFLTGGVTGYFIGVRVECAKADKKPAPVSQVQNQPRRPVEEWSNRFQKLFIEKVGITAEQKEQLFDPLFQSAQVEFRQLRDQFGQHAADVTERLDAQVMALLTDEQKPKYEQLIKERQERFKKKEAERAAAAARGDRPPAPPASGEKPAAQPAGDKPAPVPTNPPAPTPPPPAEPAPAK